MWAEWKALDRSDKTSLILTLQVAIISSFFLDFTGMILITIPLYIFLRYVQRPWSKHDDKSVSIFERHK
jgi:hypothetical protein